MDLRVSQLSTNKVDLGGPFGLNSYSLENAVSDQLLLSFFKDPDEHLPSELIKLASISAEERSPKSWRESVTAPISDCGLLDLTLANEWWEHLQLKFMIYY